MSLAEKTRSRILVVDNEPIQISVLGELLRPDFDILVATTGERALASAESQKPDLILLDIVMAGMDGYEVCRRLKQDRRVKDIPVIFLTSKGAIDEERRGLELGAVDYITKPFVPAIVRARVRTQLELKRHRDELLELTELKNRFLSMAAHDLRSPLSSIVLMIQMTLESSRALLPQKQLDNLSTAVGALRQMLGLVNGLLDVKMIERGNSTMRLESASLDSILRTRIELLQPLLDRKRLTLEADLATVPPFPVDIDRVGHAFDNLLGNAIKFSPPGKTLRVRLSMDETWARVDVQDEGPGFSAEDMVLAFGEFQTLGNRPTAAESSTGLGLYIVKQTVEAHGGRVSVESQPSRGSTLSFTLPRRPRLTQADQNA